MNLPKKKVEVLFKASLQMPKVDEAGIKSFIEGAIPGLKIKLVEVYPMKTSVKAVITSNVIAILMGHEANEDDVVIASSAKGFNARSVSTNLDSVATELATKEKEIANLKNQVSKLKEELASSKSKKSSSEDTDLMQVFQEQIATLATQIEAFDTEKSKLEQINRDLSKRVEELTQKIAIREEAKISGSANMPMNAKKDIDALEKLLQQKKTEYEEDKLMLQDQLAAMSFKILAEQEKTEHIIKKARMADSLEKTIAPLEKENETLKSTIDTKDEELLKKAQTIEENEKEITTLKDELAKDDKEIADLRIKLDEAEVRTSDATERLNKTKVDMDEVIEVKELWVKKCNDLETAKFDLMDKNEKLIAELAAKAEISQNSDKEREKHFNDTLEMNEKTIAKLEGDLKSSNELIEDLKKTIEKSQMNEIEAKKQLNELQATAKAETNSELRMLEVKLESTEKILANKMEEIKSQNIEITKLKAKAAQDVDNAKVIRLKAELEEDRRINERMLKESNDTHEEFLSKLANQLDLATKTINELKEKNRVLQNAADEKSVAAEIMESLQKRHELLIKENTDLKAALFEMENTVKGGNSNNLKMPNGKKINVIEEIQQILAEVIYAYQTMRTNAKEFSCYFNTKKERIEAFFELMKELGKTKTANARMTIIRDIEEELVFIKGLSAKVDSDIIINCLKEVAEKKSEKLYGYQEEIGKYDAMEKIAVTKVAEYEQRLVFYC